MTAFDDLTAAWLSLFEEWAENDEGAAVDAWFVSRLADRAIAADLPCYEPVDGAFVNRGAGGWRRLAEWYKEKSGGRLVGPADRALPWENRKTDEVNR